MQGVSAPKGRLRAALAAFGGDGGVKGTFPSSCFLEGP